MSIWCSWPHIGTESTDEYEVEPGMTMVELGDGNAVADAAKNGYRKVEHRAERGEVRAYLEGFSNQHPSVDENGAATVDISHIAPWCVPGHREGTGPGYACETCGVGHDYPESGPWVRLDVSSPNAVTYWNKSEDGEPAPKPVFASVVLDEAAARALAADLIQWADSPHLYPSP